MGAVFEAEQSGLRRRVAVKVPRSLLADRAEIVRRFQHEAELIARLEHINILPAVPVCSPARVGGFWTHCSRAPHALAGRASDQLESRNSDGGARGSAGSRGTGLRKVVSTA
jgi:hypothetical protein